MTAALKDDDRADAARRYSGRPGPLVHPDSSRSVDDPLRRVLLRRPTFGGALLALVFWWRSLYPTLMPRTWVTQALISALCVAIALALGTLAGNLAKRAMAARRRTVARSTRQGVWKLALAVGAVALLGGMFVWPRWQNDQREVLSMEPLSTLASVPMVLLATVLLILFVVIGRLVGRGVRRLHRALTRRLPRLLATPLTVVLLLVVGSYLFGDLLGGALADRADDTFSVVDDGTNEGTVRPTDPSVSGSPASLVEWDSLGLQGRDFVAHATSKAQLEAFAGPGAATKSPIRVYAGIRSAPDAQERADLAVRELERTGAFGRAALVVVAATGTGWVDPDAAVAIEQMYAGDTALVSMQYSYLPSWIATLLEPDGSAEAASELFEAVHERWAAEPEASRPQLLVFGQSLGSFGAEAAFAGVDARASVANMVARTEGVLLTGPTNDNLIWRQLTEGRDEGSPVWRPVFDGGRNVRFANRDPEVGAPELPWDGPRILYIQHPTDPVTFWSMDTLWTKPEWMDRPRGVAVPERGGWFPVVTWAQGIVDLMTGFGAPPGFGHDYRLDFVSGWAQVAPPQGWTAADTTRLETFLRAS